MAAVTDPDAPIPPSAPPAARSPGTEWPDPDLDPEYPDVDGAVLEGHTIALPEARTLALLRCHLTDCVLEVDPEAPLEVHDSVLTGVDLTGRRITDLHRVRFDRCRLGGADLGDATVRDVTLRECVLDLSAWRGAQIERVVIDGGRLDGVDLSGARLTDVVFAGVAFTEVVLDRVRSQRVDLTGADLTSVREVAQLRGCTIAPGQAALLAARLAAGLGVRVRDDG